MVYRVREDMWVGSCVVAGSCSVKFSGPVGIEGLGPEVGLGYNTECLPPTPLLPAKHHLQKILQPSPNNAVSREPSVQIHELMENIVYSNHNTWGSIFKPPVPGFT